ARFATPLFGADTSEMRDGSTFSAATVETYWIEISADEYASAMENLRRLESVPSKPPARSDDGVVCLHAAGVYFELVQADKRLLLSRNGCDADFDESLLPAGTLVSYAMNKLPSASHQFEFVAGLFDEMAESEKRANN
ncbi:MAG: hypothetical protein ACX939_04250, partial [Hyphococcus sp.]